MYLSGDNASLAVVRSIVGRLGEVAVGVLHGGASKRPALGDAVLSLTAEAAVVAARIVGVETVAPIHFEGWGHYSEGSATRSSGRAWPSACGCWPRVSRPPSPESRR